MFTTPEEHGTAWRLVYKKMVKKRNAYWSNLQNAMVYAFYRFDCAIEKWDG